jgi:formylglycine-generating enzyme required for sulfatase activity
VRPTAEGLAECTLVDFDDDEIETFVGQWTRAIEQAAGGDTAVSAQEAERERQELLAAARHNPGVRRLAANPLLLTILALMKRQGIALPERRAELYQKYVETLLSSWNRARGLGRPPTRDLDVPETLRVLAPIALWMHEVNPGVGLVAQTALTERLHALYQARGESEPEKAARQFLADVREYSGLLLERGAGQYGFVHLTFEEYLSAMALAQQGQQSVKPVVNALAARVGDPAWREISLLTVGYLGLVQQRDQAAGAVVEGLLTAQAAGQPGEAVVLAGEAVADVGPGSVTPDVADKTVKALLQTLQDDGRVPALVRADAGRALGALGDPRDFDELVTVRAGPFWMGEGEKLHQIALPTYRVSKYPVTVGQWKRFLAANPNFEYDPDSLRGPDNHPAHDVSWHDACTYCAWLTKEWRTAGQIGPNESVRLPTEAEWEKAARGDDQREWPWEGEFDPNRANISETDIDRTCAVGIFPRGASPYGVLDMAGNVWEWCQSKYKPYPYQGNDGREDLKGSDSRVLRGGAFFNDRGYARCASRYDLHPASRNVYLGFRVCVVSPGSRT